MANLNWIELGDVYYNQANLYDLSWEQELEIEHFIVAGARYGGPIGDL
jgi:hypothetical protein